MNSGCMKIWDLFEWINERHAIWCRRNRGDARPWTTDIIMRQRRFTNVFRQLDRGTVHLRMMLVNCPKELVPWVVVWYRMFNQIDHAIEWVAREAVPHSVAELMKYMQERRRKGKRLYSSAHRVGAAAQSTKYVRRSLQEVWEACQELCDLANSNGMRVLYERLLRLPLIGRFTAYEVVCDLRHILMKSPVDALMWSVPGPGARRGLELCNLPSTADSVIELFNEAPSRLSSEMMKHLNGTWPPFEPQEIEHSLCEYFKYERCICEGLGHARLFP